MVKALGRFRPILALVLVLAGTFIGMPSLTAQQADTSAAACDGVVDPTGVCVIAEFANYRNTYGSIRVHGYALSEAFVKVLSDGQPHLIQYFERSIMEEHMENKGIANDIYTILLGQSGRRLRAADPPLASFPPGENCRAETGHCIDRRFNQTYLDSGDWLIFGHPISEAFEERLEDGQVHVVQYFERARLEIHTRPNGTTYVEFGLLGRHYLFVDDPGRAAPGIAP